MITNNIKNSSNLFNDLPKNIDDDVINDILSRNSSTQVTYFPDNKSFILEPYNTTMKSKFNYNIQLSIKDLKKFNSLIEQGKYIIDTFNDIATSFYDVYMKNKNEQELDMLIYLASNNSNYKLALFSINEIEDFLKRSNFPCDYVDLFMHNDYIMNNIDFYTFIFTIASSNNRSKELKTKIFKSFYGANNVNYEKDYTSIIFQNVEDKNKFLLYFNKYVDYYLNQNFRNSLFLVNTKTGVILTKNETYFRYLSYVHSDLNDQKNYQNTCFNDIDSNTLLKKEKKIIMIRIITTIFISFINILLTMIFYNLFSGIIAKSIIIFISILVLLVFLYVYSFKTLLTIAQYFVLKDYNNHFSTNNFEKFSNIFLISKDKNKLYKISKMLPLGISNLDDGLIRVSTDNNLLNTMLSMIYFGYKL